MKIYPRPDICQRRCPVLPTVQSLLRDIRNTRKTSRPPRITVAIGYLSRPSWSLLPASSQLPLRAYPVSCSYFHTFLNCFNDKSVPLPTLIFSRIYLCFVLPFVYCHQCMSRTCFYGPFYTNMLLSVSGAVA